MYIVYKRIHIRRGLRPQLHRHVISENPLFRLFHEDGVRVFDAKPLQAFCRCSQERIESVLASFEAAEREDMVEDDGLIRVTCEYCSTTYEVRPSAIG
jgi:molecular chaperone Hsp33